MITAHMLLALRERQHFSVIIKKLLKQTHLAEDAMKRGYGGEVRSVTA
jgi:hypothetical protein